MARGSALGLHLRVGLFVNALDDSYSLSILRGVLAAAHNTNTQIVAAVGGVIEPAGSPAAMRNHVYGLFGTAKIDGLVVEAASLSSRVGISGVESWLSAFQVPIASVGLKLEGVPSFVVD